MSIIEGYLGAIEIGVLISIFLFGIFNLQAYVYYRNYPNDSQPLRILVAIQWVFEFAHAILICHLLFTMTINDFMKPEKLATHPWSISISGLCNGIISFSAQTFFAHRVYICFGTLYVALICWILSVLRFIGIIAMTVFSIMGPKFHQNQHIFDGTLTASLVLSAFIDSVLAGSLCYHLTSSRRNTMSRSTIRMVDRVVAITFSTGLATSITAIAMIICNLALPDTAVWLSIMMFEAEVFSNSLLANLNSRLMARAADEKETTMFSTEPQSLNFAHSSVPPVTGVSLVTGSGSDPENYTIARREGTQTVEV